MLKRAVGIIIKNDKILLIRRIKEGEEYYVFPGGGVMEESVKDALIREINEELSLSVTIDKLLFKIENQGREEHYFLVKEFIGKLKLGGEENERMNKNNQYYPQWISLRGLSRINNLYPELAKDKIMELHRDNELLKLKK